MRAKPAYSAAGQTRFAGNSPALELGFLPDCAAEPHRIGFRLDDRRAGYKKDGWLGRYEEAGVTALRSPRRRHHREGEACLEFCSRVSAPNCQKFWNKDWEV
jgi:hypothetical protein